MIHNPHLILFYDCRIFGLIIIGASFNMPCIARNFYFILTGLGKGAFNFFCGLLLLIDDDRWESRIMAIIMLASGIVFVFLSRCRHMSDEQLQRAMSINTKEVKKRAAQDSLNYARDHQDEIKQAAYDNRDVIAQVAYENKDAIAQAAYDNREVIAETYIRNQNAQPGNSY